MKIFSKIALLFGLAWSANAQVLGGFESPESVFVGEKFIYVANIGREAKPDTQDLDGFISKLSKDGAILERKFAVNLNAPKGMIEIASKLYVVDIDRLVGFDERGKMVLEAKIKGAAFLNDIVAMSENTLLISDTGNGVIYEFDLRRGVAREFMRLDLAKFGGANLLSADKKVLFAACYHPDGVSGGQIIAINLANKAIKALVAQKGAYDGIAFSRDGDLLVSDWGEDLQGKIYKLSILDDENAESDGNSSFSQAVIFGKKAIKIKKESLNLPAMKGPADIFADFLSQKLFIPKMLENEFLITNLP